ncbi:MAG TPA: hypothetical protein VM009_06910 [Terriglobales bacterium]|nr:hypothetical protein [Terriglobales bacterium]
MSRIGTSLLIVLIFCSASDAQAKKRRPAKKTSTAHSAAKTTTKAAPATPPRTVVAEGRYELRAQAGAILQSWEEPWTLYKTKTGYEVEEVWKASRQGSANSVIIDVFMSMATGLYPTQIRVGSALSPSQLSCSMTMTVFKCVTDGKEASMAMSGLYNFFLPSPWLLSSIGRRAPKKPDQPVNVKLVQMSGMSADGPKLAALDAEVAYVGEDVLEISGSKLAASIYEIRGKNVPAIVVWISTEGVVLMMQDAAKPEQRMELVEFKKVTAF